MYVSESISPFLKRRLMAILMMALLNMSQETLNVPA